MPSTGLSEPHSPTKARDNAVNKVINEDRTTNRHRGYVSPDAGRITPQGPVGVEVADGLTPMRGWHPPEHRLKWECSPASRMQNVRRSVGERSLPGPIRRVALPAFRKL
jgi:hypothetical protein